MHKVLNKDIHRNYKKYKKLLKPKYSAIFFICILVSIYSHLFLGIPSQGWPQRKTIHLFQSIQYILQSSRSPIFSLSPSNTLIILSSYFHRMPTHTYSIYSTLVFLLSCHSQLFSLGNKVISKCCISPSPPLHNSLPLLH